MKDRLIKNLLAAGVMALTAGYLAYYVAAQARIEPGRDAIMFGSAADTSRTIHLRTDFASFYFASKAVAQDLSPYAARTLDTIAAKDRVANHVLPYLYPPFLAIVAQPLTTLSPADAQQVWDLLQIAAAAVAAALVFLALPWRGSGTQQPRYWTAAGIITIGAVVLLPFRDNVAFGQVNVFVLLFMALSFHLYFRQRWDWLAGASLAVAALLKVTPAIFLMFFVVNKRFRAVWGFAGGLCVLVLASFDAGGKQHWLEFWHFLPNMGYARNVDGGFHPSIVANFSLAGFLMRVFVGEAPLVRLLTMVCAVLMFAALLFVHLKKGNERNEAGFVLPYLILMVIASPVTWLHHLVYLLPGLVFVLRDRWFRRHEKRGRWSLLVILALVVASSYNFQAMYPAMAIPEELRPFVTSLNLYTLLALFGVSLFLLRNRPLLVSG